MVKVYNKKIYFRNYRLFIEDNFYLLYLSLIDIIGWLKEIFMIIFFVVLFYINVENYN